MALLVPTTLLAQHHFQNLSDRFADWLIKVETIENMAQKIEALVPEARVEVAHGRCAKRSSSGSCATSTTAAST